MPTTKTAEKEMRVAERRRLSNKSTLSQTKTRVRKAEEAIASGNLEVAQKEIRNAVSALDKEAEKGKSHRNSVARRKSRLARKLNKAEAKTK